MDEIDHVIVHEIDREWCLVSTIIANYRCCNLECLMLVTSGPSAMIPDLNMLCFLECNVVLNHIYELYILAIVRNPRPQR